jgi:alpha-1,3-rhamnosyl/mannosyltransferase
MSDARLTIAIDAREMAGQIAGKGRYVVELVKALAEIDSTNSYFLYSKGPIATDFSLPKNFKVVRIGGLPGLRQLWLAIDAKKRGCDVLLSPTGYLPVIFSLIPSIVTIHDLAIFTTPEAKPALKTFLSERLLLKTAVRRAKKIMAVSQSTKNDLVKLFQIPADKVTVTPLGYDRNKYNLKPSGDQAILDQYQLAKDYLLFIGTLEPRKNIEGIIKAYSQLPTELQGRHKLVIAGKKGWYYDSIFQNVESLGLTDSVQFLGRVPDEHLPALYRQAKLFIFPSYYEGFGLPVLEALACGTPVVSSHNSSLPEVVGDCGRLVDPRQPDQISQAIGELLRNQKLYLDLKKGCANQAAHFSWQQTAMLTLETIKSLKS